MTNPLHALASVTLVASLFLLAGCPEAGTDAQPVTDADADGYVPEVEGDAHAHTAKYGGEMIEVGEHEYSLETLEKDGKFMVYVMDAHHEEPVMISPDDIEFELDKEDGDEVELESEALEANDEGMTNSFAFTMPEGMTTLEGEHGHFHVTINGKKYDVDLHDGHDHDHDHDGEMKKGAETDGEEADEPVVEEK